MNQVRIENDNLIIELKLKESGLVWSEEILPYFIDALNGLGYSVPSIDYWSVDRE